MLWQILATGSPPIARTKALHTALDFERELPSREGCETCSSTSINTRRPRIAVIDDDPHIRKSLNRLLASFGYRTESFASAAHFLSAPSLRELTCLILDVELGAISGLDLAQHPAVTGLKVPIILISGSADEAIERQVDEQGGVYLRKPFDADKLREALAKAARPPVTDTPE